VQKIFLVSDADSLNELNDLLHEDEDWFVSEISQPNQKGEWLVVLDDEPNVEDDL